jgi:hypothetical protein
MLSETTPAQGDRGLHILTLLRYFFNYLGIHQRLFKATGFTSSAFTSIKDFLKKQSPKGFYLAVNKTQPRPLHETNFDDPRITASSLPRRTGRSPLQYLYMHTKKCTPKNAHQRTHTKECTPNNAHQRMHTKECPPTNAHQRIHTKECTPKNAHRKMHTKECTPKNAGALVASPGGERWREALVRSSGEEP